MSEEISSSSKLRKLISPLNEHFNLIGEDIADILWLALKQKEYSSKAENETAETLNSSQLKTFQFSYLWLNFVDSRLYRFALILCPPLKARKRRRSDDRIKSSQMGIILFAYLWISFIDRGLYLFALLLLPPSEPKVTILPPKPRGSSGINQKTLPLRHPDPPSLQEPLEFAKALRPLIRKVDSGRKTVLDEVETVQRTAEENICVPVFKNEPEPWLDLALIVDENPSMVIWNSTIKELKQLLERYGIFREARIWGLGTDDQGKMVIRAKVGKKESFKNPQELVDPTNRRLILIVSDCVAPIWFDGTILSTLEQWTKYQPLAIIQMLPNFMWQRTGLRIGAFVELSNLISGAANRNLRIHELLLWKEIKVNQGTNINQGTKIPVLTLNPEITSLWSNFVVGKYDSLMTGFVLPLDSDFQELPPLPQSPQSRVETLDAEQRVNRFRRMSSPVGRNLAGYLMAAPVITLPVVRLIQKIFLPHSQPIHMAEVFLGGLLKPSIKITTETNPDGVVFDVIDDEIRNIILDDFPLSDSVNVFRAISNFIESNIRKSLRECVALLADPSAIGDKEALAKAYAEISLKVLKGMGESYAELAKEIEISSNLSSRSAQTKILFETLGIEPKTLPFEIATFEEVEPLSKITFKIVILVRKEQIKNRLSLEEINLIEKHNLDLSRFKSRYQSYEQLSNSAREGTDYRIETHQGISDAVIIAPHGGKIEPGASQITKAIAGEDHSFYSLEGLKSENNHDLSIPSEKFDESRALKIVGKANRVIAIHIFFSGEKEELVHLGGLDTDLKQKIKDSLEEEGFITQESGANFESKNLKNICNRGNREKGVNIGIARALMQKLLNSLKSEDSNEPTLFDRFIQAIRDALSPLEAAGLRAQITQGEADYYTEDLGDGVKLDMISIPGGSFMMGAPETELESRNSERPQHKVNVPTFFMGRYPITQEQWQAIMDNNPSEFKGDKRPVERVSWDEAKEFCDRLSQKTNREYRLPTEAEWEYACRAGTKTPFHYGETITTELANYNGNYVYGAGVKGLYRKETTEVGEFPANEFGLCDMHGNVWEWCKDDWHENYEDGEDAPTDGRAWVSGKSNTKVVRGGSWSSTPGDCRSATRGPFTRVSRYGIGFRVVCVVPRTT